MTGWTVGMRRLALVVGIVVTVALFLGAMNAPWHAYNVAREAYLEGRLSVQPSPPSWDRWSLLGVAGGCLVAGAVAWGIVRAIGWVVDGFRSRRDPA